MNKLLATLLVYLCLSSAKAQTFPGGVKPLEDRLFVQDKLPPTQGTEYDPASYKSSIYINVNGIKLYNLYCRFGNNKLLSVYYEFAPADRSRIITALKNKYKRSICDDEARTCFTAKNMSIEVGDKFMIYYAESSSNF